MADISDLPMLHDIDADYSPQYVKLARTSAARPSPGTTARATPSKLPISSASTGLRMRRALVAHADPAVPRRCKAGA